MLICACESDMQIVCYMSKCVRIMLYQGVVDQTRKRACNCNTTLISSRIQWFVNNFSNNSCLVSIVHIEVLA